jgi:arsenate reductase
MIVAVSLLALWGCGSEHRVVTTEGPAAMAVPKKRVIILCTGNSCRSQMAEALWRRAAGDRWEVVSAGTNPKGEVHPLAIKAMEEIGIDIRGYHSKSSAPYVGQPFDLVVTVCDNAERECPSFRSAKQHEHWPFPDPPKAPGTFDDQLKVCREVRDGIEAKIKQYLARYDRG